MKLAWKKRRLAEEQAWGSRLIYSSGAAFGAYCVDRTNRGREIYIGFRSIRAVR
jgi:hypothetical protein